MINIYLKTHFVNIFVNQYCLEYSGGWHCLRFFHTHGSGLLLAFLSMKTLSITLLMAALAVSARAQEAVDLTTLLNTGVRWADENLPAAVVDQIQLPSAPDWKTFWDGIQHELQAGSIEDLAEWMPYVEFGSTLLLRTEEGREYAAWLRQQLDYFEVAAAAVGSLPDAAESAQMAQRPRQIVTVIPPARPVPRAVSPGTRQKRDAFARSASLWQQKLRERPVPLGAPALIPRLKRAFQAEGVPAALVWIAEVESSLDPRARNPGGASGLFQLMPGTAQRFGLRTAPLDERRDPDKSARAAARYLRFLYGEFGSWPLTVAAYNSGEGRVKAALKATRGYTFQDIGPSLPLETRLYVPKVTAVVNLREGVENLQLPEPGQMTFDHEGVFHEAVCWN